MTRTVYRRNGRRCPECASETEYVVLLVETQQTSQPIEKPRGFICSGRCGWETSDLGFFDQS